VTSSAAQTAQAEHHEHEPSPRLARLVERAVGYRIAGYPAGVHVGMPSGTVTLVVPLDAPLTVTDGGSGPTAYGSVLAGLSTAPAHIHHDGNQHGVQLALRPGAVRALFGVRAAEVAGGSYELVDVMGPAATTLRERLHETDSWATRFALVEQVLLDLERDRRARHEPAPEVTEAWRLIRASGGAAPIRDVAARIGWSMRRLQTQFGAEFGVTPKALARVRRFERSLPLVAAADVSLADVAARCGWSDHAHMDRDWRELAGTSPTRWRTDDVLIGA
jgi:AraC-like DNA-binding protein